MKRIRIWLIGKLIGDWPVIANCTLRDGTVWMYGDNCIVIGNNIYGAGFMKKKNWWTRILYRVMGKRNQEWSIVAERTND